MLVIEEFYDWHPRVAIVDVVAKTRGINDGQANWFTCQSLWPKNAICPDFTFEEFLLQLSFGDLNLNGLIYLLCVTAPVVCVILDGG